MKTDRRDAELLARLLLAGKLHAVRVPGPEEEALRDLVRAREAVRVDLMRCRHRLSKLLLRHGIRFDDGLAWTQRHRDWLARVALEWPAAQATLLDCQGAIDVLCHRREQLEREIVAIVPGSPWATQIGRLRCLRGVDTLTAVGLCSEVGDFERFARAERLWRELIEPAQPLLLIHPYPELELPRTIVPVMDLTEQLAEKIVGWSAHGLMKHYVDVAWAFYRLADQIDPGKLGQLVDAKLELGRSLFRGEYAAFPTREDLRSALEDPDGHVPPQGDPSEDKAKQLRFDSDALNKQQAIHLVRTRLIPVLFE